MENEIILIEEKEKKFEKISKNLIFFFEKIDQYVEKIQIEKNHLQEILKKTRIM